MRTALLYVCLLYRPTYGEVVNPRSNQEEESLTRGELKELKSTRPGQLWQWKAFGRCGLWHLVCTIADHSIYSQLSRVHGAPRPATLQPVPPAAFIRLVCDRTRIHRAGFGVNSE